MVAGEIANAIELILACVACVLPVGYICGVLEMAIAWREAVTLLVHLLITECLAAADLAPEFDLGAMDKTRTVGRLENFVERSRW